MVYKKRDSQDARLQLLEELAAKATTTSERNRREKDIAILKAGAKGEDDAAYHIDFELKDNQNWAVIHDIRLEWGDRVAQIDHLMINRLLETFVVESKSFRTKVRYANGGWERLNFNHWEGIPSPVEQNERHLLVLKTLMADLQLAPKRLGTPLAPIYRNVVLVAPSCSIVGEYPKDVHIHRMDSFVRSVRREDRSLLQVFKIISPDTLQAFALRLVAYHKPAATSTLLREAVTPLAQPISPPPVVQTNPAPIQSCQGCGGPLSSAEANYCRTSTGKFGGKLLCRGCQKPTFQRAPAAKPIAVPAAAISKAAAPFVSPTQPAIEIAARCAGCGDGVESKVVAFCRFNSKRFGKRVLCRNCQSQV